MLKHYVVVGVLEDIESFYDMLEKYIPRFFSGIKESYLLKSKYGTTALQLRFFNEILRTIVVAVM